MEIHKLSFTASYTNCAHNFSIYGLPSPTRTNSDMEIGFACVLLNLLHRGERTTKASEYLKAKLGELELGEPYYLSAGKGNSSMPNWYHTIKGSEDGNNPARLFFEKLWVKYLPEYAWLRQFVIAEAKLDLLLSDFTGKWKEQAVDFYLAPARLVIEIDGGQHKGGLQKVKDRERDSSLSASGIQVLRFTTAELYEIGPSFQNKIESLKHKFADFIANNRILEAKECNSTLLAYEQVMRFQILILSMIRQGCLSITQKTWCFDLPEPQRDLFTIASEDIFLWLKNLYRLVKKPFSRPKIVFRNKNAIKLKSELFERIDDANCHDEGILIYTDYYDDADYFRVASNGTLIQYDVDWPIAENGLQKEALLFVLKNLFQYDSFNPGQLSIIAHALMRKDTIGILPTGSGKSLCYFLCCLLQPTPSFAVCPIISLLIDQEKNLREFGVTRVANVSSMQEAAEKYNAIKQFGDGRYLLIWISPERFQNEKFREQLLSVNHSYKIGYAVIDEVHCLSEWGHDFRTSYLTMIKTIRKYAPQAVLLGLTATASQAVLLDLKNEFGIDSSGVRATHSMGRKELNLEVKTVESDKERSDLLGKILSDTAFATKDRLGLIFTQTKRNSWKKNGCIDLCEAIHALRPDLTVESFHGELSNANKERVQSAFMSDKINIMTATKAFGMGINKKDIRYTIHYGMPMSIESFYQEAGRAGRDHESADCTIIYTPDEHGHIRDMLFEREVSSEQLNKATRCMQGDLNTLFYLWQLNNKGVDQDVSEIYWFLKQWPIKYRRSDSFEYFCEPNDKEKPKDVVGNQAATERALYHLKLLGVVEDWTIQSYEYATSNEKSKERKTPCVIRVYMNVGNLNPDSCRKHFLNYIKRYNPLFEAEANEAKNKRYFDIIDQSDGELLGYARALITWMYEHIGYTRRVAIRNLLELCDNFKDSDSFRSSIEDYLKIDEKNSLLDEIAIHPENWKLWLEAFQDIEFVEGVRIIKPLTEQGLASLAMSTARYLESYADNAGLDYIYLVSKAISGSINNSVDVERLEKLIGSIVNSEVYRKDSADILQQLIEALMPYKDKASVPLFCAAICKLRPQYAEDLYAIFEDDYSLSAYLANVTATIKTHIGSVYI